MSDLLNAEIQERAAEVTDFDAERGIVDAKVLTYEQRALVDHDLWEVFTRGALDSALAAPHRIKMSNQQHDMMVTIGRALELRNEGDALYGRFKIADTAAGRDVLTLLREGVLDELSIEFAPAKRYMKVDRLPEGGMLVRHDKATLKGISPVARGAYGQGSKVLAVRAKSLLDEIENEREVAAQNAAADLAARREVELQRLRGLIA